MKTVLIFLAGAGLLYVGYRSYCGNGLLGSNRCSPDTNKVQQPATDEDKLNLLALASTLEAKLNGVLYSTESKSQLQLQLQQALAKLK